MARHSESALRDEMRPFVGRNDLVGYGAVVLDFTVYFAAVFVSVASDTIWLQALASIVAGTMISTLFVLGHDAAHGSLVSSTRANEFLARALLLPALHNYTLWRIQHNRLHHQTPNVKGLNSWSPFSPAEFAALPRSRRWLERVYRGGGFGLYYLRERWWKDKFYPSRSVDAKSRPRAMADFALLAAWIVLFVAAVLAVGARFGQPWWSSLLWGVVVPYAFWNTSMGLTVYLQHTHTRTPWFRSLEEAERFGGQESVTVHVKYPRWYGLLSHEIMEHPAHHINPLIPFYHLRAAQQRLNEVLGEDAIVEPVGPFYIAGLLKRCKLYDYDRQAWTDFSGTPTARTSAFTPPESSPIRP